LVSGEIPLAARSHRLFGNTLLKAGHLMRLRPVRPDCAKHMDHTAERHYTEECQQT
jgi:hypothetical protein